jgi:hypothetical protein
MPPLATFSTNVRSHELAQFLWSQFPTFSCSRFLPYSSSVRMNSSTTVKSLPLCKAPAALRNALAPQQLLRVTFTSHSQALVSEPMALPTLQLFCKRAFLDSGTERTEIQSESCSGNRCKYLVR